MAVICDLVDISAYEIACISPSGGCTVGRSSVMLFAVATARIVAVCVVLDTHREAWS